MFQKNQYMLEVFYCHILLISTFLFRNCIVITYLVTYIFQYQYVVEYCSYNFCYLLQNELRTDESIFPQLLALKNFSKCNVIQQLKNPWPKDSYELTLKNITQ